MKICAKSDCNEVVQPREYRGGRPKKFCSVRCRERHHAAVAKQRMIDDPAYRERRLEYMRSYNRNERKKNRYLTHIGR